jgi:hypothetical protein
MTRHLTHQHRRPMAYRFACTAREIRKATATSCHRLRDFFEMGPSGLARSCQHRHALAGHFLSHPAQFVRTFVVEDQLEEAIEEIGGERLQGSGFETEMPNTGISGIEPADPERRQPYGQARRRNAV